MTPLALAAIRIARSHLGPQETSPNDGPLVREWLADVGMERPMPWCAAFATWCVRQAAREVGARLHFRGSAGALRLLDLNQSMMVLEPDGESLEMVIWDHGGGKGHVGIITGVTRVGGMLAGLQVIAGNTSADGLSRDADSVAERGFPFPSARQIAGYLRIT